MKTLLLLSFFPFLVFGQNSILSQHSISQISNISWNTSDGLPYRRGPGVCLGATSFELLDANRISYLCDSSGEIIITDKATGKIIKRFEVAFAPRDFVYEKGKFYVLADNSVYEYDENGSEITKKPFPQVYAGVSRLTRFQEYTYLLLPSGNSVKFDTNGLVEEYGWITGSGLHIYTEIRQDNSYLVNVIDSKGITSERVFKADKKVAGIFVVGATQNSIVLDLQTFISENPISVERNIISVDFKKGTLGNITSKTQIPECYYVMSNKDFIVNTTGEILNMISAPSGTFVFSLTQVQNSIARPFPNSILTTKYHFNNHLVKVD